MLGLQSKSILKSFSSRFPYLPDYQSYVRVPSCFYNLQTKEYSWLRQQPRGNYGSIASVICYVCYFAKEVTSCINSC